jgi:hypothetical protein
MDGGRGPKVTILSLSLGFSLERSAESGLEQSAVVVRYRGVVLGLSRGRDVQSSLWVVREVRGAGVLRHDPERVDHA